MPNNRKLVIVVLFQTLQQKIASSSPKAETTQPSTPSMKNNSRLIIGPTTSVAVTTTTLLPPKGETTSPNSATSKLDTTLMTRPSIKPVAVTTTTLSPSKEKTTAPNSTTSKLDTTLMTRPSIKPVAVTTTALSPSKEETTAPNSTTSKLDTTVMTRPSTKSVAVTTTTLLPRKEETTTPNSTTSKLDTTVMTRPSTKSVAVTTTTLLPPKEETTTPNSTTSKLDTTDMTRPSTKSVAVTTTTLLPPKEETTTPNSTTSKLDTTRITGPSIKSVAVTATTLSPPNEETTAPETYTTLRSTLNSPTKRRDTTILRFDTEDMFSTVDSAISISTTIKADGPTTEFCPDYSQPQSMIVHVRETVPVNSSLFYIDAEICSIYDGNNEIYNRPIGFTENPFVTMMEPSTLVNFQRIHTDIGLVTLGARKYVIVQQPFDAERRSIYQLSIKLCAFNTSHLLVVYVDDVNDEHPKFKERVYRLEVTEGIYQGSTVGAFPAEDPDTDAAMLRYKILSADVEQFLTVDDLGTMKTASRMWIPDLRQRGILQGGSLSFEFRLFASDGLYNDTTLIIVEIKAAVELQTNVVGTKVFFLENLPKGSLVANFRDIMNLKDTPLTVVQLSELELFKTDPLTGNITSKVMFDREERLAYSLLLEVNIGSCFFNNKMALDLDIFIDDVNDNQPEFTPAAEYICTIPENSKRINLLTVALSDNDDGNNSDVILNFDNPRISPFVASKIESSSPYNAFEIGVRGELDFETSSVRMANMTAWDSGNPPTSTRGTLTLNILDENDNSPLFNSSLYSVGISQDIPNGSIILSVNALDADTGQNADLTYELMPGSGGKIRLDSVTGDIIKVRDFTEFVKFGVIARDNGFPSRSAETTIHVTPVGSINITDTDSSLGFVQQVYRESVSEQAPIDGPGILSVMARYDDGRITSPDDILYSLGEFVIGNKENIRIDLSTGIVSFRFPVDYEVEEERFFVFNVLAANVNNSADFAQTTVFIKVVNSNDEAPVFTESVYSSLCPILLQATGNLEPFLYIRATDGDKDANFPALTYSLSFTNGTQLTVDPDTGLISVLEKDQLCPPEFEVSVTDGQFTSSSTVQFNRQIGFVDTCNDSFVINVRENSNRISLRELLQGSFSSFAELSATGLGDYFGGDKMNPVLLKPFDYEERSTYESLLHVSDKEILLICPLTVNVINENDNPPRCSLPFYTLRVPLGGNTALSTPDDGPVTFSDLDPTSKGILVKTIPANIADVFRVANTGVITLVKDRTKDVDPFYQFSIHLTDAADLSLTSTCIVQIEVEAATRVHFVQTPSSVQVSEAQSLDTVVLTVEARSFDKTAVIRYSMTDNSYLEIDGLTGELIIRRKLDYETDPVFIVTVTALESVARTSRIIQITVIVEDYNDNPPVFGQQSYLAVVDEEPKVGDVILKVNASDVEGQAIYYGIEDCGYGLFTIGSTTGEISLARSFETLYFPNVTFVVTATDGGKYSRTSRVLVKITVPNFNLHSPKFMEIRFKNSTVSVFEGANNSYVTRLVAFDADANDKIEYRLPKSEYSEYFRINQKGEIWTTAPLDREQMNEIVGRSKRSLRRQKRETPLCRSDTPDVIALPVLAIDSGVPRRMDETCLLILVVDINDIKPTFNVNETILRLPQNFVAGSKDEEPVLATDLDLGVNGEVIYYLTSRSKYFTIETNTGKIEAKKSCPESCIKSEEYVFETLTIYANNKDDIFEMSSNDNQFLTVHVLLTCLEGECGLSTTEITTIALSCTLGVMLIILVAVLIIQYKRHKIFKQGADRRNLERLRRATETNFQTDTEEYDLPHDDGYQTRVSYLHPSSKGSANGHGYASADRGYNSGQSENNGNSNRLARLSHIPAERRVPGDPTGPHSNGLDDYPRPQRKRGVPFMTNFNQIPQQEYMQPMSRHNSE